MWISTNWQITSLANKPSLVAQKCFGTLQSKSAHSKWLSWMWKSLSLLSYNQQFSVQWQLDDKDQECGNNDKGYQVLDGVVQPIFDGPIDRLEEKNDQRNCHFQSLSEIDNMRSTEFKQQRIRAVRNRFWFEFCYFRRRLIGRLFSKIEHSEHLQSIKVEIGQSTQPTWKLVMSHCFSSAF